VAPYLEALRSKNEVWIEYRRPALFVSIGDAEGSIKHLPRSETSHQGQFLAQTLILCQFYRLLPGTYPVLCAYSIFCQKIRFFEF